MSETNRFVINDFSIPETRTTGKNSGFHLSFVSTSFFKRNIQSRHVSGNIVLSPSLIQTPIIPKWWSLTVITMIFQLSQIQTFVFLRFQTVYHWILNERPIVWNILDLLWMIRENLLNIWYEVTLIQKLERSHSWVLSTTPFLIGHFLS